MKIKYIIATAFTLATIICTAPYVHTSSSGAPVNVSGAPGESTCNQSGCHSGNPVNDGNGTLAIKVLDGGTEVNTFVPGKTYEINVDLTRSGAPAMGFEATVKNGTTKVGTLAKGSSANVKLIGGGSHVTHTNASVESTGHQSWTFNWTAPATGNAATVYAAGNAANNSGTTLGDFIYTASKALTAQTVSVDPQELFSQNMKLYPNPVENELNIGFTLPENSTILAELISLDGKTMRILVQENMPAGNQQLQMQTGFLPQGTYMLRLKAGNFTAVQKVLKK